MSEFKFACPICGQHMQCDSSQAGSVMECPTCLQKITAPQSTATGEQKFILTGTKFATKRVAGPPAGSEDLPRPERRTFPAGIVAAILLLALAAGGGYFFLNGRHPLEKPWSTAPPAPVLSADWQSADIGNVGAAGTLSQADGVATLGGSGADIWHRADGFHFVFQPLDGDGALCARVLNVEDTEEWAKAGVMIRESTNAGSMFALASIRADGQAQMIWRKATGAEAQASALTGGQGYPKFVKIVRTGGSFAAYYKINDADAWSLMCPPQPINMATNTLTGLVVCSHHDGFNCNAQFDQVALQTDHTDSGK